MESNYYKNKMEEMLRDDKAYEMIPNNNDKSVMNKIRKLTEKYKDILTDKEIKFLSSFESKTSLFYGMPKIHKCESIISAIQSQRSTVVSVNCPADLTFRPIVAGTCCPTHRLSHLMDVILQPFLMHVKSYVRDSMDILNKLPNIVNSSTKLITLDVESLYNNITHNLGLRAIAYWLNTYPEVLDRITPNFVMESIALILENDTFTFDGKYYKQLIGTAMGTKCAPAYAALTLGYLEIGLYENIEYTFSKSVGEQFKNMYKRYLDDVLIIMSDPTITEESVYTLLNNLDENLTFKIETSGKTVNFLDITISIKNNTIDTDIFYKSTDSKQYLNFKSCHPRHIKQAVPYNLARRICTIVSEDYRREYRLNELCIYLKNVVTPKI